ncbi:MAG TPA: hypothetical protein EYP85_15010 [Armatimonadetes bacterium]|nr:hypothetical protein [Armatimonadota bacterium]
MRGTQRFLAGWICFSFFLWFPASFGGPEKLDAPLRRLVAQHSTDPKPVGVIVQTVTRPTEADYQLVAKLQGKITHRYRCIPGFAARIPIKNLLRLSEVPRVKRISADLKLKRRLDYTVPATGADVAYESYGLTGKGIGVAVIDSGIAKHNDFGNVREVYFRGRRELRFLVRAPGWRIIDGYDFLRHSRRRFGNDELGHGTLVAGIIAGSGYESGRIVLRPIVLRPADRKLLHFPIRTFYGIARKANLVNLRILGREGYGYVSDAIAAIDLCLEHADRYRIRVINLSVGHAIGESYRTDPLCQACEAAWKAGIVVVVAAGNYGAYGYGTIDSPGNDPYVITVGAMNTRLTFEREDDVLCYFSAKGPTRLDHVLKPDLVAPGNRIISAKAHGSYLDVHYGDSNTVPIEYYWDDPEAVRRSEYFVLSGTSMAAAVVSGAVALMLEKDPSLTPDDVKGRLMATAEKRVGWDIFSHGAGYLDIPAALNSQGHILAGYAWSPLVYRINVCREEDGKGLFSLSTEELEYQDGLTEEDANEQEANGEETGPEEGVNEDELWEDDENWVDNLLWGEGTWEDTDVWGDNAEWADPAAVGDPLTDPEASDPATVEYWVDNLLWGDGLLWSDETFWVDNLLWGEGAVEADVSLRAVIGED